MTTKLNLTEQPYGAPRNASRTQSDLDLLLTRPLSVAFLILWLPPIGAAASEHQLERLMEVLSQRIPGITADAVTPSPVEGLYEVDVQGKIFYVTEDGRYALSGKLMDLATGRDLTEGRMSKARIRLLDAVSESKMIIFEPEAETKYTITTFTDIDCPYCRKMHSEIDELNTLGVRVRYMWYPRAGENSTSYEKAVSVWCADDQQAAMTRAKAGKTLRRKRCENPVLEHMAVAQQLGLAGTPMTITETGERIMGYVPPRQLVQRIKIAKSAP